MSHRTLPVTRLPSTLPVLSERQLGLAVVVVQDGVIHRRRFLGSSFPPGQRAVGALSLLPPRESTLLRSPPRVHQLHPRSSDRSPPVTRRLLAVVAPTCDTSPRRSKSNRRLARSRARVPPKILPRDQDGEHPRAFGGDSLLPDRSKDWHRRIRRGREDLAGVLPRDGPRRRDPVENSGYNDYR